MQLERHPKFKSKFVPARNIDIWLPPDYGKDPDIRYPVIYMHDGQNLFLPEESFIGVDWGIDATLKTLILQREIHPVIAVGIWNTANRFGEYMPELALATEEDREQMARDIGKTHAKQTYKLAGEAYLSFIVKELKPWIDTQYHTLPGQRHTSIMGSSMGGLISLYALCRYPDVFFGAGCLSTAWGFGRGSLLPFFETALPDPATHRIYMDLGGKESANPLHDEHLQAMQATFDNFARAAGYQDNLNFLSLLFPNHEHSESYWRNRVDIPLRFLLLQLEDKNS